MQRVLSERPSSGKKPKNESPKASPSLQDLEKAQFELENQLGTEPQRRESTRPKSANIQSTSLNSQIEPKKPDRNNTSRGAKITNDTGTQDLIQNIITYKCKIKNVPESINKSNNKSSKQIKMQRTQRNILNYIKIFIFINIFSIFRII